MYVRDKGPIDPQGVLEDALPSKHRIRDDLADAFLGVELLDRKKLASLGAAAVAADVVQVHDHEGQVLLRLRLEDLEAASG